MTYVQFAVTTWQVLFLSQRCRLIPLGENLIPLLSHYLLNVNVCYVLCKAFELPLCLKGIIQINVPFYLAYYSFSTIKR